MCDADYFAWNDDCFGRAEPGGLNCWWEDERRRATVLLVSTEPRLAVVIVSFDFTEQVETLSQAVYGLIIFIGSAGATTIVVNFGSLVIFTVVLVTALFSVRVGDPP